MRDGTGQTTSEDSATQLLIWETLSLANIEIDIFVKLSTFELLTFLLITFDIFINSLI